MVTPPPHHRVSYYCLLGHLCVFCCCYVFLGRVLIADLAKLILHIYFPSMCRLKDAPAYIFFDLFLPISLVI